MTNAKSIQKKYNERTDGELNYRIRPSHCGYVNFNTISSALLR